jgi:hypothetical protein
MMRPRSTCGLFLSVALLCAAPDGRAQEESGRWYIGPYLGGIIPDKPWHATGSAVVYGVNLGRDVLPGWAVELDFDAACLRDRSGAGHSELDGGAVEVLRVLNRAGRIAPYLSIGAGATHFAPALGDGLEPRTELMVQPAAGAFIRLWEGSTAFRRLELRPSVEARWTHGWAHAPGNPVDPIYLLGLSLTM